MIPLAPLFLLFLLSGCRGMPLAAGPDEPCQALGRVRWMQNGRELDATAVAHYSPPATLFLRLVDPIGRSAGELRTDGDLVRVTRRDERVYWEGRGEDAMERVAGVRIPPSAWVSILRGLGNAPPGWTITPNQPGPGACLATHVSLFGSDRDGHAVRLAFDWDSGEPWSEAMNELGPAPAGYERVFDLPIGETPKVAP